MKIIINNEQTKNKDLVYEERFWTGKRTITFNGVTLTKLQRNIFEYKQEDKTEQFEVKGNQITGVTINMFGTEVEISRKLTWYEIFMAVIVFIPCVLFGAVGGAIGGALGFTNLTIIRQVNKLYLKIIISVLFALTGLLLSYILACLILKIVTPLL